MNKLTLVVIALALGACSAPKPVIQAPQPLTQEERDMVARRNAVSNGEPRKVAVCNDWCREWQYRKALYEFERAVNRVIYSPFPLYGRM